MVGRNAGIREWEDKGAALRFKELLLSCASFTSSASGRQMGFGVYLRVRKALSDFLRRYISTMAKNFRHKSKVRD